MFVLYDESKQRKSIKIWLNNKEEVEEACLEQAMNLANLPFVHKWVSLMPDTHAGYGMPIGGVLATTDVIIPNAVGVDIGCGMAFIQANIPAELLRNTETPNGILAQAIIGNVLRNVPVGFAKHNQMQDSITLADMDTDLSWDAQKAKYPELAEQCFPNAWYQIGTLGGGNHFIELQADENDHVAIMIHSGSRNLGKQVADFFNKKAVELNKQWYSDVPAEWKLPFLPVNSEIGQDYIKWMQLAMDFAKENRDKMMQQTKSVLYNMVKKYTGFTGIEESLSVNAHHNYAAIEHHYGKNVWVHRKGAIRARKGELGIVPGAMGSYSYIVEGLGNEESFMSCSHGAGRKMSRKKAREEFPVEQTIVDLKEQGVYLGKHNKADVSEESRFAYKDIDAVIENELDLIKPIKKLKTVAVIKG